MKKLKFSYEMTIDYSFVVSRCNFTIKCIPKNTLRQRINRLKISVEPSVMYHQGFDGFNNKLIYGLDEEPHTRFVFKEEGEAICGLSEYDFEMDEDLDMVFAHPHGLNIAGPKIREYYNSLVAEGLIDETDKNNRSKRRYESDIRPVAETLIKEYGDQMVEGIFSLMKEIGIWLGKVPEVRKPIVSSNPDDVSYLNAAVGGLFIQDVKHSQELKKGDRIGRIVDPLTGKVLDDVKAPVDGLLFTIREYPIVDEGSLMGRMLRREAYKA